MQTLKIVLVATTLITGAAAPAFATDTPSYKEQMTNLWIATGDPTYARLAGLSERQLQEAARMPVERQDLD